VHFYFEVNSPTSLFEEFLQTALPDFAQQGVLIKDLTVLLDGARPANTFFLPTLPGIGPVQPCSLPTQKYICKCKNRQICVNHFL
jgi:hypothetical protein